MQYFKKIRVTGREGERMDFIKNLASSSSLETLTASINGYFCQRETVIIKETTPGKYTISNGNGLLRNFRIVQKGTRYIFQRISTY